MYYISFCHLVDSYTIIPLPTGNVVGHRFDGLDNNAVYFVSIEKKVDHTDLNDLGLVIKSM
jgi:hypothetical protein